MDVVQGAIKGILFWDSWVIGNLNPRLILSGVVVDV